MNRFSPSLLKGVDVYCACYHPLSAIVVDGQTTVNGKRVLKIVDPLFFTFWNDRHNSPFPEDKIVKLPCGQCVGCRIQYSREWANRCMLELQYHDSAYFVTLTYSDKFIPRSYYADPNTGEAHTSVTLCKRDFQLFMKRLRRKFGNDHIRFFMSGEYGSTTFRPHYHAIIFGLHLDDLSLYKKSPQGFSYYNSPSLQACWSDPETGEPLGFAVCAEVTWETCAYTARYVMKKLTGKEAEFYTNFNIQPEFTLMSRKPGIARQYYDDHPDLYKKEFINVSTEKGGLKFRPPRYFDKLYDLEHPDEMEAIKDVRKKMAVEAQKAKLQRTSVSPDELLAIQERAFEKKIHTLRRPLE